MPARVQPFPFYALSKIARKDAVLARRCARLVSPLSLVGAVDVLAATLGARPVIAVEPMEIWPASAVGSHVADTVVALILDAPRARPARARTVVAIDPELAHAIVDRALGGEGRDIVALPDVPLGDAERGVLAYVVARALGATAGRWKLEQVVTTRSAVLHALGHEPAAMWHARVALGSSHGVVRAFVALSAIEAIAPPEHGTATAATDGATPLPRAIACLPLELVATCGSASLSRSDARSLRGGDVLVLDSALARRGRDGIEGDAELRVAGARRTCWRCTVEHGTLRVVAVDRSEERAASEGRRVEREPEDRTDRRAVDLAADAPVEVSVEIARFKLPLGELSSLQPGEILATGRAVGDHVVLRAGEQALAIGELVDVDGEVGVRILSGAAP